MSERCGSGIAGKIVGTVDTYEIDESDADRAGRAVERAAHTADAVSAETESAVLERDVLRRTTFDAFQAMHAFLCIDAEQPAVSRIASTQICLSC